MLEYGSLFGRVLDQFVIESDYSEISCKCKGTGLFLYCGRNRYKNCFVSAFSVLVSLFLCSVFNSLHSDSESESAYLRF